MIPPKQFQKRISLHNRHAFSAAVLSLFGAWLGWMILYGLVMGVLLTVLTLRHSQEVLLGERLLSLPWWIHPVVVSAGFVLLLFAAIGQARRRYRPVDDRPVIGWHNFSDILLLPARLTLAVWSHFGAVIHLGRPHQREAFELLQFIYETGRVPVSSLGAVFPNRNRLQKNLAALQLAGWIDFRPGNPEPCYVIPSSESDEVTAMVAESVAPTGT